jgi:hypothetical protein
MCAVAAGRWDRHGGDQHANPNALRDISAAFSQQIEAKAAHVLLADPSHATPAEAATFIAEIYQNLFDRAPDAEGATTVDVAEMMARNFAARGVWRPLIGTTAPAAGG